MTEPSGRLELSQAQVAWLAAIMAALGVGHMALSAGTHQLHVAHLSIVTIYLAPVLAAALWLGLGGGVLASSLATALFALQLRYGWAGLERVAEWWSFSTIFWVVGVGGGVLVDLQRKERGRALARERAADRRTTLEALASLAAALGSHDPYARAHGERVGTLAAALGTHLGLSPEQVETLGLAGLVHDIGKLGVADDILLKPGELTVADRLAVERHPEIAAAILQPLRGAAQVASIVLCHHECPDGSGYPRHLSGQEIPVEARVLRVADVFCSLSDARPYKAALPVRAVLGMMRPMAGTKLEPDAFRGLEALVAGGSASVSPAEG